MTQITCTITRIEALTPFVSKVVLKPQSAVHFMPGQYLQLWLNEQDKRAFSIASIPSAGELELHIGAGAADQYASQAIQHLQHHYQLQQPVIAEVGLGHSQWQPEHNRPVILLAGGTGFSYVYSIARAIAESHFDQPVFLYWGVRQSDALYYQEEMQQWAASNNKYRFIPVVQQPSADWQGRTGLVHQTVLDDFVSLDAYDIYIAGPFPMVGTVRDAFLQQGAHRGQMYADAFAYI
ncbi:NAD(P)H-flavin reductase [Chromatiaceae bacterium AAb-1]|nr:NAD(P)H-flavin reductase [Chromatiaceae bacterium AAb-1]